MNKARTYSARTVFDGMKHKLHQYLEAQYHIWDEGLIGERKRLLESEGSTFQEPRLEATPFYTPGKVYGDLQIPEPAKAILNIASREPSTGIPKVPYSHQAESVERFLGQDREIVVATGTGSGKTECFLMPILGTLASEANDRPLSWVEPGCRALLLYPMNALVNDQLARLRRLLGNEGIARHLQGGRNHRATFGMYTSRTPYPGEESAQKNERRLEALIRKAFLELPAGAEERLKAEGKWPVKNLDQYLASSFKTGESDSEMLSRQEMQSRCPDVLVTNYSMLEYMLLRPIEAKIFDQTASWLSSDKSNKFIVVLDEAHMYRGSAGAEVAYLLRRLQARLGISRDRMKFILTSASLGTSSEAQHHMKAFASDLSGADENSKEFEIITGLPQLKIGEREATPEEGEALSSYDFSTLHTTEGSREVAVQEFRALCKALGYESKEELGNAVTFQNAVYTWLQSFGPAAFVANKITSKPQKLSEIAERSFPGATNSGLALEALLALMAFAKEEETGKVFAPVRAHLFFRGLPGIYACINPKCKSVEGKEILGKLYSTPRWTCECGSRVYEVLTHRDCGAAFIRGYVHDQRGDFLWHQPSEGLWGSSGMLEAHFLVEINRRGINGVGRHEGSSNWLHKKTGRLSLRTPESSTLDEFVELLRPDGLVHISGQATLTFNNQCPVCTTNWRPGSSKIMDLATKGEAPFAQLIRMQVELQPQTMARSYRSPNGGQKSLLFSDGRQKAARLARDVPREIENDVFRQLILLAAKELIAIQKEPRLTHIYPAMLHVLAKNSLLLFDGDDRIDLQRDVNNHQSYFNNDLEESLGDRYSPPPSFNALLLRHLGSPFYSVSALTLAHLSVAKTARSALERSLPDVSKENLERVLAVWIQSFANYYAIDRSLSHRVRVNAAGHPLSGGLNESAHFNQQIQMFLREKIPSIDRVFQVFTQVLGQTSGSNSGLFVDPNKIAITLAKDDQHWSQCEHCAKVFPFEWWGQCPFCLSTSVTPVNPGATDYLRARKAFFRDPVIDVLDGKTRPFNLSVEEHTAQLSYRDIDDVCPTTEDFERRFRDILVLPTDTSIDVLSSTTTMEVGIDIGSLVAVGLRNVPPLRQNYQQRAGRTGRRGSAISTVVTYAQNSPHDSYYFDNPDPMIAGEPTLPGIDTANPKIIERHICAQLIQFFFHFENSIPRGSNIFSVLGKTMDFYDKTGAFSLTAFEAWLGNSESAKTCFTTIQKWLPKAFVKAPARVASSFVSALKACRPLSEEELEISDQYLIEFLFNRGFLPSYAFPRDICALQIEGRPVRENGVPKVEIIQRPQQGLSVALSEYAPGRFVVVDKKTYRIGTVAASGSSNVENRATRLFAESRNYFYCPACGFTPGFSQNVPEGMECSLCGAQPLETKPVIVPQVVFPAGAREVDEHDDEQVFTNTTSAQLSVSEDESFIWKAFGKNGAYAFVRDQQLVMVNKGEEENGQHDGFRICKLCGRTAIDDRDTGSHKRDYHVIGRGVSEKCQGEYERVYLGYGFNSDVLLLRIPLDERLRFDPVVAAERAPISDAMQSLAEAMVLGIVRVLGIDSREINAGFRFLRAKGESYADIFVYDTLSGGAGYATQAGQVINEVLERVASLLLECDCAPSCNKCLRHYGNRFHHAKLDRMLAYDLLRYMTKGELPSSLSNAEQKILLHPLIEMLTLAGWVEENSDHSAIVMRREDGKKMSLHSYPSLVRPEIYGFVGNGGEMAFSAYEVSRDLPGAYGLVAR